jgi:hypothetical protein
MFVQSAQPARRQTMTKRPSVLDEVAAMVSPLTTAREFLNALPADERAEWDELLRRGDVYPGTAVMKVFAKRGIVLDRHAVYRLRAETAGYVPSR